MPPTHSVDVLPRAITKATRDPSGLTRTDRICSRPDGNVTVGSTNGIGDSRRPFTV